MSLPSNSSVELSASGVPQPSGIRSKRSVSRYVLINFSVFLVLVLAFFSFTINLTYQWGSDDTFHYFLTLQAEKNNSQTSLANNSEEQDFKIYHQYQDLPQAFKSMYPEQDIVADDMLVYETEESFNYILPYQDKSNSADNTSLIYIEHPYYFYDDEYDVAISIPQLIGLIISCALVVGLLFYFQIAQKLSSEIKRLADWVAQIQADEIASKGSDHRESIHKDSTHKDSTHNDLAHNKEAPPQTSDSKNKKVDFPFAEIQMVAHQFQLALGSIQQQTEREKNFLKSLSHELRTPLAIIKASLELIEKTGGNLPEKVHKKLEKIRTANQSMCDSSDSLLQIWSASGKPVETEPVDLNIIVTSSTQKYQHLVKGKSISTSLAISREQLLVPAGFAQIVVDNLIKNAFQYSSAGEIKIQFENDRLSIINPLSINPLSVEPSYTQERQSSEIQEFGYGVGLFVVETICQRANWRFSTESTNEHFLVAIDFGMHSSLT